MELASVHAAARGGQDAPAAAGDALERLVLGALCLWFAAQVAALGLSLAGYSSQGFLYKKLLLLDFGGADSWGAMEAAWRWLADGRDAPVYDAVFFDQKIKFQYPLTSLLIYPLAAALGVENTVQAFNAIGWICVVVQGAAAGAIADALLQRRPGGTDLRVRGLCLAAAALVTVTFYPVVRGFGLGQVQTWITTLFLLASLCWLKGRMGGAGLLIGCACLFKPQLGLFLLWAALRRNRAFATGFLAATIPAGLASLVLFGLGNNLGYLDVLAQISRQGEVFVANQSVNGLAHRLLTSADSRVWTSESFAPYSPAVHAVTVVSCVGLMLFGLLFRRRSQPQGWTAFLVAALAFTLASPVAWEHHFGFVAIVFVALLADAADRPRRGLRLAVIGLAYALTSHDLFAIAIAHLPVNSILASFFFFAMIAVLVLLSTSDRPSSRIA